MNIRLTIQFDGTNYHGWQRQANAVSVEETLSDAIFRVTKERARLVGCGRTDAGVHALNYVCSFRTNAKIPVDRYPYALNALLPEDIVCLDAREAEEDFCANRSASAKRYIYRIWNSPLPDAFRGKYSWHYKYPLDLEKMRAAAEAFVGEHDFIGFASAGFSVKTTVRTIYSLTVDRDKDMITIDICGNGFLYNMVRIIAGTLVYAGSGRIDPLKTAEIIESKRRENAGITAPPRGLCLKEVYYGRRCDKIND